MTDSSIEAFLFLEWIKLLSPQNKMAPHFFAPYSIIKDSSAICKLTPTIHAVFGLYNAIISQHCAMQSLYQMIVEGNMLNTVSIDLWQSLLSIFKISMFSFYQHEKEWETLWRAWGSSFRGFRTEVSTVSCIKKSPGFFLLQETKLFVLVLCWWETHQINVGVEYSG